MKSVQKAIEGVGYVEREIAMLIFYMDQHLSLLHQYLQEKNEEAVTFQKEQLEKIRQRLCELEYFPLQPANDGSLRRFCFTLSRRKE
jgi:c-di-GMP-binding flagellar brake protein YcgR